MSADLVQAGERMRPMVDILLATCNGGRYLAAQLDSIIAQSFTGWRLLVRDDGSTDDTRAILSRYARRYADRIMLIAGGGENLGACRNFAELLAVAEADYIMFSDQDDHWLPDKIGLALRKIRSLEAGGGGPALVFTDAVVVDENLRPIAASAWRYQNTTPPPTVHLNRLLLINPASGCTMMVNRALRDLALPIPREAIMHDYWLALVAAGCGACDYLDQPTLLFRRHGQNETEVAGWGMGPMIRRAGKLFAIRAAMARNREQARAFYQRYGRRLDVGDRQTLEAYLKLPHRGFWGRRLDICRYRLFPGGLMRNLGWLVIGR